VVATEVLADDLLLRDILRATFPRAQDRSIERLVATQAVLAAERGGGVGALFDGREIGLILSGQIATAQTAPDGRVSYLGVYGSGTLVGLPAVDGEGPSVDVEALDPVRLATWPADLIRDIAVQDTGLLLDVVDHLAYRVRFGLHLLERQTFAPARARLASFLIRNVELVFTPGSRLLRRQMAAMAGISQEMLGRILRRWEREGIVRRDRPSRLTLLDRARLEQEAAAADMLAPEPRPTATLLR
jgi:CRP-like cAMP-binding protein